ncbi:hypothetical protein OGATHE_003186 [Ogataea polymorpha]|uniref:Uncharacterized protein n=1 Tax=Ogataea polymorpha TaxID=460523 RepID=A0A9P8P8R9_9ASCO|nr:hypothetical protein OGATHE_003186 [Ogataea polymorpha]
MAADLWKSLPATGFDLSGSQSNSDVSNCGVLGLTRSVRHHDTPAGSVRILGSIDRLGQSTNLVDLQKQSVGTLLLDGSLDSFWVRNSQVITNNLDVGGGEKVGPSVPVILGEWVLQRHNWILLDEFGVQVSQLLTSEPLAWVGIWILEVQVVFAVVVKSLLWGGKVWSNTSLITDVTGTLAVLLLGQRFEVVVDLRTHSETLGERWSVRWHNHELLEGQGSTGVRASVQNVLEWDWQNIWLLGACQFADVLVQWDTLELVKLLLFENRDLFLENSRSNDLVDVGNSLQNTLSEPLGLVAVSQLNSLVNTGTGTRWNN